MQLIVVDRTVGAVPEIPNAIVVKKCYHPTELALPPKHERLSTGNASAMAAAKTFINQALDEVERNRSNPRFDSLVLYVEILNELPERLTARIGEVKSNGEIGRILAVVNRGRFFANTDGVMINTADSCCASLESFELLQKVLELARFIAWEL